MQRDVYSVRYVDKVSSSEKDVGKDVELSEGAFADRKTLGRALRDSGVLLPGARVDMFRVEGGKVVVFPCLPGLSTYWHSVILTRT